MAEGRSTTLRTRETCGGVLPRSTHGLRAEGHQSAACEEQVCWMKIAALCLYLALVTTSNRSVSNSLTRFFAN